MGIDLLSGGEVAGLDGLTGSALDLGLLRLLGLGASARRGVDGDGAADAVGGRHLQQLVDDRAQLLLGHRSLEHRDRLAGDKSHDRGDGLGLERLGDLRGGVDIHARQLEATGVLPGELLQDGGEVGAHLAAQAVQDDDDGDLGGDLGDVTQAGGVDVDHERHRQAPPAPPEPTDVGVGAPPAGPSGLVAGAKLDRSTAPNMLMSSCLPRAAARLLRGRGLSMSFSVGATGGSCSSTLIDRRREPAGGPTPGAHGVGPVVGDAQDGLADAAAVGAGVWESSRSTLMSAVSAPRIAAFSPLPSLGMAKATMES